MLMVAMTNFNYAKIDLKSGEQFEAEDGDVFILEGGLLATKSNLPKPAVVADPPTEQDYVEITLPLGRPAKHSPKRAKKF